MNTAENLNGLLKAKGWTSERLAVELQQRNTPVSIQTIGAWRSGRRTPSGTSAVALADALGCTTDAILRGPALEKAAS
jgi:transcriptional regulator with XRE-family HTH domain